MTNNATEVTIDGDKFFGPNDPGIVPYRKPRKKE